MVIRDFNVSDIPAVAKLHTCFRSYTEAWYYCMKFNKNGISCIVIEEDETIAAVITYYRVTKSLLQHKYNQKIFIPCDKDYLYLVDTIVTKEKYRKRGYATKLLNKLEDQINEKKIKDFAIIALAVEEHGNIPAQNILLNKGYKETDRIPGFWGKAGVVDCPTCGEGNRCKCGTVVFIKESLDNRENSHENNGSIGFILSKPTFEDLPELAELYSICFEEKTDLEKMKENYKNISDDDNYVFLAIKDKVQNKIVGFVMAAIIEDIFEKCRPIMTLWSLCVHPSYRRKGLGEKLLTRMENIAQNMNCDFITFISGKERTIAHKLYMKLHYDIEREKGVIKFL